MALVGTLVEHLGWTLLHFIWQGLLVGIAHELALRAARRQSPRFRYGISLSALLALALAPIATLAALTSSGSGPVGTTLATAASIEVSSSSMANDLASAGAADVVSLMLPYLVLAWLIGVCLLSIRFGIGVVALRNLVRQADYEAVSDWMREELERLAKQMGITRRVRIALSTRVGSPLVVGWLKPVIFLPLTAATGLDHRQISLVLAHELAHLRRYDHVVNLLQVAVETLLFYHPAVHRVSRALRQEREQCCDDMAIEIGGNKFAYARVLAELEEMRQQERTRVLALGIAEQELYTRIERLVRNSAGEDSRQRWLPVVLIAAAGMLSASHTLDFSAPLLPSLFETSRTSQRVSLTLPAPSQREFVPIRVPAREVESPFVAESVSADEDARRSAAPASDEPAATSIPESPALATPPNVSAPPAVEQASPQKNAAQAEPGRTDEPPVSSEPIVAGGELVRAVEPRYPRRALRGGQEGFVEISFTITAEGNVMDTAILNAEPRGTFDEAALAALEQWKFKPFTENGTPVAKRVSQVLEFRLSEKPLTRGGTPTSAECREQTGTRLCRAAESEQTRLTILND